MGNLLTSLLAFVLVYKYFAIFVITFLGAFALPLPSGSVLMAAAAFSLAGYMNFWAVFFVGLAGNIAGDNSGYWLVRKYGIKILHALRLGRFFKQDSLNAAKRQIEKHPIISIFFSRFMTAIAPAVNVVCGITELRYFKFLFFEVLGEITEVSIFCGIGYFFGTNWEYVDQLSGSFWIVIVAGMLASIMFWKIILKKEKIL